MKKKYSILQHVQVHTKITYKNLHSEKLMKLGGINLN